jgi:hypothetical protein
MGDLEEGIGNNADRYAAIVLPSQENMAVQSLTFAQVQCLPVVVDLMTATRAPLE